MAVGNWKPPAATPSTQPKQLGYPSAVRLWGANTSAKHDASVAAIPMPKESIRLAVFDIGGTVAIPYCTTPEVAFDTALRAFGIVLDKAVIRDPMGIKKKDHLKILFANPVVIEQWKAKHNNKLPSEADIQAVYDFFEKTQNELLKTDAKVIPYAVTALDELNRKKIPAIATTGFHRNSTKIVMDETKLADKFEHVISADDPDLKDSSRAGMVLQGMTKKSMTEADAEHVLFVSDSKNDIENVRKRFPKMLIIGVAGYGTHMAISSMQEADQLTTIERAEKVRNAAAILKNAGADLVITDLSQLKCAMLTLKAMRVLKTLKSDEPPKPPKAKL